MSEYAWTIARYAAAVLLTLPFALAVRALVARARGLVLTDWLGYLGSVALLVAVPSWQFDINPWLLLSLPVALALGIWLASRSLSAWGSGQPVQGAFVFGTPAPGVTNWVKD